MLRDALAFELGIDLLNAMRQLARAEETLGARQALDGIIAHRVKNYGNASRKLVSKILRLIPMSGLYFFFITKLSPVMARSTWTISPSSNFPCKSISASGSWIFFCRVRFSGRAP